ncbi:MAG: hypothetical protein H7Z17_04850 [Fuerstia sp.]|nr:hypothetical protein [Fuerstiella sp.]
MVTTKATKAADKSQVCRKFVTALHKMYGKSVPKIELPVIETLLFAACLEDNPWAPAEAGLKKLIASFFDLNEIRVSSVNELELVLAPLNKADWKGLRIRSILRSIFESTYSYDFEKLRRQTLEQAVKTLKKMPDVTPFIRDFVLHEILGSHIVCLDESMLTAAKWLGLVPETADLHEGSEYLKGGLKKSEVSEFCYLLRCLATDPKFVPRFVDHADTEQSMEDVMDRFAELQLPPKRKPNKPPAAKEILKPEKVETGKKPVSAPTKQVTPAKPVAHAKAAIPSGKSTPATKPAASASKKVAKPVPKPKAATASKSGAKPLPKPKTTKSVAKKTAAPAGGKSASSSRKLTSKPGKKK